MECRCPLLGGGHLDMIPLSINSHMGDPPPSFPNTHTGPCYLRTILITIKPEADLAQFCTGPVLFSELLPRGTCFFSSPGTTTTATESAPTIATVCHSWCNYVVNCPRLTSWVKGLSLGLDDCQPTTLTGFEALFPACGHLPTSPQVYGIL